MMGRKQYSLEECHAHSLTPLEPAKRAVDALALIDTTRQYGVSQEVIDVLRKYLLYARTQETLRT